MTYDNNVAIIEIEGMIHFDEGIVHPAVLPSSQRNYRNGKLLMAIPFRSNGSSQKLLPHEASLLSQEHCNRINGNTTTNSFLCVDSLCLDPFCDNVSLFVFVLLANKTL